MKIKKKLVSKLIFNCMKETRIPNFMWSEYIGYIKASSHEVCL